MKKLLFTISFLMALLVGNAQSLKLNYEIDTNLYEFGEPLRLWLDFLKAENDSIASQYWNYKEVEKYGVKDYFYVKNTFNFQTDYHIILKRSDVIVLSITENNGLYKFKTSLAFPNRDSNRSSVMYIFNVYAKKEMGTLKLYNALKINEELFLGNSQIGKLKFYYPKHHIFNDSLAQKQTDFLEKFGKDFDVPVDTVSWYFAETNEELQRMKGFDFLYGETSDNNPSGKADVINNRAFGSGLGEYYPHELIHVLINSQFPNSHLWFNEGLCTYYGGSRGKDLEFHLKRMAIHLNRHPDINLDSMLNYKTMDNITGYRYALGGYLMKIAFEKGGIPLQKKLLQTGRTEDDFYNAIENHLGIKQKDLNEVIRKVLREEYMD